MTKSDMLDAIKIFENRQKRANERAIDAILHDAYTTALSALHDAIGYQSVIDEYRIQIEIMEVSGDE